MAKLRKRVQKKKKLGRPSVTKSDGEGILSNGLLQRQWDRVKLDCGSSTPTEKLRQIVDWYYKQIDSEAQAAEINEKLRQAELMDEKV